MKSKYSTLASSYDDVPKLTTNEILRTVKTFAHTQDIAAPYGCLAARASVGLDPNAWCRPHGID